jgi:tetratricopeptide (TPR) repeat protein
MAMLTEEKEAIAQVPDSEPVGTRSTFARAKCFFDRGNYTAAIEAAGRVLSQDSDHLGALEVRVRAEWRLGDFPAVLRSIRKLTLLNPYEPGYFLMQGDALRMLGRLPDARTAYERCVQFEDSPARLEAMLNIEDIDRIVVPATPAAQHLGDGLSEFMPPINESMSAWMPVERVTAEDAPAWADAARPS